MRNMKKVEKKAFMVLIKACSDVSKDLKKDMPELDPASYLSVNLNNCIKTLDRAVKKSCKMCDMKLKK